MYSVHLLPNKEISVYPLDKAPVNDSEPALGIFKSAHYAMVAATFYCAIHNGLIKVADDVPGLRELVHEKVKFVNA